MAIKTSTNQLHNGFKNAINSTAGKIDPEKAKSAAARAAEKLNEKTAETKGAAENVKKELKVKTSELDQMLQQAINEYNDAYTLMSDKGLQLYIERCRASDTIELIENLVNSIANRPKSFESDFAQIIAARSQFTESCEYADRELHAAREAAGGAGAGLAAGASVAFMAPTAAMWVATTFGTASTGTAISALSGAAATNAALAWLGGGALAAGGGGMVAGNALLALAGPIGWSIAGASLLSSIVLFTVKKNKLNKQKNEEIDSVKVNILAVKKMDEKIAAILENTKLLRSGANGDYIDCLSMFNGNYITFTEEQKIKLGILVNSTKALSAQFKYTVS